MNHFKSLSPILYVDDEEDNLIVFNSTFRRDYEIHLASSARIGLEILKKHEIHVIITDQRMPEMTGIQFLERIIPDYPDCIRMILTGFSDIEAIIQSINTGRVYRYITKPWSKEELKINIDKALEIFHLREENRKLIEDLKEANQTLEQKVFDRTKQIEAQKMEIMDSIHYASKIQQALLPPFENIKKLFPEYFILNQPRDIVSGDFYWLIRKNNKVVAAVADCTGHGVPGAFMSILGITLLSEVVNETDTLITSEILNQLRLKVIKALHQSGKQKETRDGIEMALCLIDLNEKKIQYSGAFRPLYLIKDNNLTELKGDLMPIGVYPDADESFTTQELQYEKGDHLYLSTDGFSDQIGGSDRKTFRSRRLKNLLLENCSKPMNEQKAILEKTIEDWRCNIEQVDDILILGIKI